MTKRALLAGAFWAASLVPMSAQSLPFDLNDPLTLYAVMMFYDNTCGGLPPDAKIALFRWQVTIPSIAIAVQLSMMQETVSRSGLQKFCADFEPVLKRF